MQHSYTIFSDNCPWKNPEGKTSTADEEYILTTTNQEIQILLASYWQSFDDLAISPAEIPPRYYPNAIIVPLLALQDYLLTLQVSPQTSCILQMSLDPFLYYSH